MEDKSALQLHIFELHELAVETFGSESKANEWLNTSHVALEATPVNFVQSTSGFEEIKKILNAIRHGGVI